MHRKKCVYLYLLGSYELFIYCLKPGIVAHLWKNAQAHALTHARTCILSTHITRARTHSCKCTHKQTTTSKHRPLRADARTLAQMHADKRSHTHAHVNVRTHTRKCTHAHAQMHSRTNALTRKRTQACAQTHASMRKRTHTSAHARTHPACAHTLCYIICWIIKSMNKKTIRKPFFTCV